MTMPPDHTPAPNQNPLHFQVASELSRLPDAPDMTENILSRLGYRQVDQQRANRRRLMRLAGRASIVIAMVGAVAIGFRMFEQSPDARRAVGPTVPAALGSDLQQRQQSLGTMFRTIRNLAPRPAVQPMPPENGQRAMPGIPGVEAAPAGGQPVLDDAVERSAIGPMKWV